MEYLVLDESVAKRWHRVKDFLNACEDKAFWVDIKRHTRELLKETMELILEEELTLYTQAKWHQRTQERLDYRNGFYQRDLQTELGPIEEIRIPRLRKGTFKTKVFERYKRRQSAMNEAIQNVFLSGVSTRRVSEAIRPLLESTFSASCVSRITKGLDRKVQAFHKRQLLDEYQYLFLDGISLKVKNALRSQKKIILAAYGITLFGKRELIASRQAKSESEASWTTFLDDLYKRGLEGKHLKLIITDGGGGLHAALEMNYPFIRRQRCWVHKLRNIANKLKRSIQKECLLEAKGIYLSKTRRQAVRRFKRWKERWRRRAPEAVRCLEKDLDEMLAFLDFPEAHRVKIRTTNVIERSFREVRRRTRPMGCFTNQASCDRIIYAVLSHLNAQWKEHPLWEFTQFI